ncbi:hypothetical protein T01_2792 [Trichinella spiralis]|uniref:Uncharacterized protein n=1 Tax=Trichinella spiralis TaxID=6334 RepID=A0A0V1AQM5_TRISP|nr:hypothetical protein T01_4128 [Trichinella spiralis]KRY28544.1 hypothetical protein T01_2792 [Trichinella spiralis]
MGVSPTRSVPLPPEQFKRVGLRLAVLDRVITVRVDLTAPALLEQDMGSRVQWFGAYKISSVFLPLLPLTLEYSRRHGLAGTAA